MLSWSQLKQVTLILSRYQGKIKHDKKQQQGPFLSNIKGSMAKLKLDWPLESNYNYAVTVMGVKQKSPDA